MRSIVLVLLVMMVHAVRAQVNMYGEAGIAYRNMLLDSKSLFAKGIKNFTEAGGANRFFSESWVDGGATNPGGVTVSTPYKFNFDFIEHELYAMSKDTSIIINNNYLKSFYLLEQGAAHYFVRAPFIDPAHFFESIGYDSTVKQPAVQLLKLRTIKVKKADKNSYAANFSGEYSDTYTSSMAYYILLPDNHFTPVKLNKKSLSAALAGYKAKTDAFFAGAGTVNEAGMVVLLKSLNQ
jgi:hypothetical protein